MNVYTVGYGLGSCGLSAFYCRRMCTWFVDWLRVRKDRELNQEVLFLEENIAENLKKVAHLKGFEFDLMDHLVGTGWQIF